MKLTSKQLKQTLETMDALKPTIDKMEEANKFKAFKFIANQKKEISWM